MMFRAIVALLLLAGTAHAQINGGGGPSGGAGGSCNTLGGSLTGTCAAATVVTNANLTGPITSTGNATAIASQTGTGSTFVMNASPSIGSLTVTTAFTATGLVTNADLVNSSLTIAGHSISLGGTQTLASTDLSDTTAPTSLSPTDASGASLVFTGATGVWTRVNKTVTYIVRWTYPTTASGSVAAITLPATVSASAPASNASIGNCFSTVANNTILVPIASAGGTSWTFSNIAGGGPTNATLSTGTVSCEIHYVSS